MQVLASLKIPLGKSAGLVSELWLVLAQNTSTWAANTVVASLEISWQPIKAAELISVEIW